MKLYRRGLEALEASQLDRAGSCLTDAIGADDRNAHAWMALGVVRFRQDRLFQAASAFDRAARLEPTRHEPHFNIGTVLESAGHHAQAVEAYNTALKLAPNQLEVMENLARCYIHTGTQPQRARELIERCLQTERRPEWRAWLQDQAVRLRPGREQSP